MAPCGQPAHYYVYNRGRAVNVTFLD
jgi:hypothetical protein